MTREEAIGELAQALYERSSDYTDRMPDLWLRSGMTRSSWQLEAELLLQRLPWLRAAVEALPSEEDEPTAELPASRACWPAREHVRDQVCP